MDFRHVEDAFLGALIGIVALAVIVSLTIGIAIGWWLR